MYKEYGDHAQFYTTVSQAFTTTESIIQLNMTDIANSNITLDGSYTITLAIAGIYLIMYTVTVDSDTTTGTLRTNITTYVKKNGVTVTVSPFDIYLRQADSTGSSHSSFLITANAADTLTLYGIISPTSTTNFANHQTFAMMSIMRLLPA